MYKAWKSVFFTALLTAVLIGTASAASADTLTLPSGLKEIEAEAFMGDTSLDEVILPEGLESIGENAFANSSVNRIAIPKGVTSIADNVFDGIYHVIVYGESGTYAEQWASNQENVTFVSALSRTGSVSESITWKLQDGMLSIIGSGAMPNYRYPNPDAIAPWSIFHTEILHLEIGDGITRLGNYNFSDCENLLDVSLPNTLQSIGGGVFVADTSLREVRIPDSVTSMSWDVFYGCTSLQNVHISSGLSSISSYVFFRTISLNHIYIPATITNISTSAFYEHSDELVIHSERGSYAETYANQNHISFSTDPLQEDEEEWISSPVEDFTFETFADGTYGVTGYFGSDTDITIPQRDANGKTVTSIGDYAFNNHRELTSINIPVEVVSIGSNAFSNCSRLTKINIPENVIRICMGAFSGCFNLTSITIPDRVITIETCAFSRCYNLTSIIIPESVVWIDSMAFDECNQLTIYGAAGSYAERWANMNRFPFSDIANFEQDEWISSPLDNFIFSPLSDETTCRIEAYIGYETNIIIPKWDGNGRKVIEIGSNSFLSFLSIDNEYTEENHSEQIISITLPDTIENIYSGFSGCTSLQYINIPKSVSGFATPFLKGPTNVTVELSPENEFFSIIDGVLYDGDELVRYLPGNTEVEAFSVPYGVTYLGVCSFCNCKIGLVTLPETIKHLNHRAFADSKVKAIILSKGITSFGNTLEFNNCKDLQQLYIPPNVTYIDDEAFKTCSEDLVIYGIAGSYAEEYANNHSIPFSTDPMPGMEPETVLTGSFSEESITISLGEKRQLGGTVSSSGADIKRITLTIGGYDVPDDESDRYTFDNFSDYHMKEVNLQYWAAFTLDTTREPLNVPGTYTVKLWARADGMENGELLDSMEVTVTNEESALNCVLNQSDISVKLGEAVLLKATVESDLLSIHQIRLTVDNWLSENGDNVYSYDDFAALSLKKVDLQDWLAFQIDTDESPFDEPGIYSVNLEANVMGQDGYTQLGVLNVTVSGNSDIKPLITYPAIDHDEVPFGSIDVSWQEVPNAQYYMMSLRDLETKELLLYHSNVGTETSAPLSNAYFSPDRDYRMAIGAVMGTDENGNDAVRWCERVFHVMPEEEETGEGILIVQVYQAEGIETNVTSRGIKLVPRTSSNPQGVENCKIIVSYFDEAANAEVIEREMYTDANGTCQMTCNEGNKFTISYVKEGMTFFTAYDPVVIHAGQNVITNYAYLKGYQVSVDTPYQDIPQKRPKGLYAEYFEQTGKNSSFTAENKLNEAVLEGPLSYRWKVISKGDYYQLNQYAFEDNNFSSLVSTINFVPEKFAAMFSGFIQLGGNGTGNNESGRPYKFRLTGDDGVYLEIEANQYLSKHDEDWGSGSSNTATVNLQQNLFKDGTVVRLYVKYYNTWGSANLKLEYSHDVDKSDSKSQWFVVPGEWLYAGTRQVYITGNTGMQSYYKLRQATVEKQLENYDKKTVKEFIDDLINSTFGSVVDEGFQNLLDGLGLTDQNSFIQKMIRQTADNVENKLTRSIYGAVSKKLAGTDESNKALWQEIYEDIANELKINVSDIDLKDIFNKDTFDAFLAYGQIKKYAEAHTVLRNTFWTDLNCITDLYVAGGSDNIKDADELYPMRNLGMLAFLETEAEDISKKQQQFVEDVQAASAEAKGAISLAKKGFNLIKELHKDANKCAATLTLLYAENGSKWTEEFIKAAMQNESTSDLLYNFFLSDDFTTRAGFEKLLIQKNGKSIAANLASLQGVNLEKVLYQEVLVMTMDTVKNYYVKMGKGLLK